MFGQMTAGSWIYIGTQGILQGTYQTFAAAGEKHFGSPDLSGTDDSHRRSRRDGRRAAARGARWPARPCCASRSIRRESSGGCGRAISTRRRTRSTTRSPGSGGQLREGRPLSVGRASANAADVVPELAARGEAVRSRHRPDRGARSAERLRAAGARRRGRAARCARPIRTSTSGVPARRSCGTWRACSSTSDAARMFSIMATTCEVRPVKLA